jgi:hypothetical protein
MAILWPTRPGASWLEGVGVRARSSRVVKAAAQFLACLALVGAVACGGDDAHNGVGGSGKTETSFTWPQVEKHLQRELECFGDSDACRETRESALRGGHNYGFYNIWVFKPGVQPTGFVVAGVRVPPRGEVAWSEWRPTDPWLPDQGHYVVVKNYGGNVGLNYDVEARRNIPPPKMPSGFLLLDRALSKLTGVAPTTAVAGINAP